MPPGVPSGKKDWSPLSGDRGAIPAGGIWSVPVKFQGELGMVMLLLGWLLYSHVGFLFILFYFLRTDSVLILLSNTS